MFVLFGEVLRSEIVNVFIVFVLFGEVLRSEIVFVACMMKIILTRIKHFSKAPFLQEINNYG